MSYYSLRLGTMYNHYTKETVEIVTIDRRPLGPLSAFVEEENTRSACSPCTQSSRGERRSRWVVRLPDSVKSCYPQREATQYVDLASLPGMLTWLAEHGYDVVELNWAPITQNDIWLRYVGDNNETEFRKTRTTVTQQQRQAVVPRRGETQSRATKTIHLRRGRVV
jgi:hypothetical protein